MGRRVRKSEFKKKVVVVVLVVMLLLSWWALSSPRDGCYEVTGKCNFKEKGGIDSVVPNRYLHRSPWKLLSDQPNQPPERAPK